MSSLQRSTGVGPTEPPYSTGVNSTEPPYNTGVGATEPADNTGVGSTEPAYDTGVGSTEPTYNSDEMMAVEASRRLTSKNVCFVGIGLPSLAANLARRTHAPGCVLVYESGTIGAKPTKLPLSIGDGELAETADTVVSVPEMFAYWLQSGRIDVGFLGAAQIDRYGNLNSTVIGSYDAPKVRLPGGGGAPEIARACREVFVMLRQSRRSFVGELDFLSSAGD